jgi:hypothetical protein
MDSTREPQGGTVNEATLAEIVGTYQAQDVRVSYEDMANPRRYGVVVEHRAGEFRVVWDGDEGETWSDLRQAGWRRENRGGWRREPSPYDAEPMRRAKEVAARRRNDHSASRRVDVLQHEAPHLLAQLDEPRPSALRIVVNMEADEPELLGTWQDDEPESGEVWYTTSNGHYRKAPGDCVRVVRVEL